MMPGTRVTCRASRRTVPFGIQAYRADESLRLHRQYRTRQLSQHALRRIADEESRDAGTGDRPHHDEIDSLSDDKLRNDFVRLAPAEDRLSSREPVAE